MKLALTKKIRKNPQVITKRIGKKIVILDPSAGEIRTLNETAGFIWRTIGGGATAKDIGKKVSQVFDVSLNKAEQDTLELLEKYLKAGLIKVG